MPHMSERFNFDDFDQQIADALEENAAAMEKIHNRGKLSPEAFKALYKDYFGEEHSDLDS